LNDEENHGNLFYGMLFYTIDEILQELTFYREVTATNPAQPLRRADAGIDTAHLYNPGWVPFGSDGSRCRLVLDLAPAPGGQYGQIIFVDGEYNVALLIAPSAAALTGQFANDLQNGLYALNEEAMEDDNHFLEPDTTIDIVNWHHIDKWKHYTL
jgi:cell wall assembly regulator SMI1